MDWGGRTQRQYSRDKLGKNDGLNDLRFCAKWMHVLSGVDDLSEAYRRM